MKSCFRNRLLAFLVSSVLAALISLPLSAARASTLVPQRLRCEHLVNPLGIDTRHPRLSWEVRASDPAARGLAQTAYQVLVASSPELLAEGRADLWDSGRVTSDQSHLVPYAGAPLTSGAALFLAGEELGQPRR